jgi:hypothetical protein
LQRQYPPGLRTYYPDPDIAHEPTQTQAQKKAAKKTAAEEGPTKHTRIDIDASPRISSRISSQTGSRTGARSNHPNNRATNRTSYGVKNVSQWTGQGDPIQSEWRG